MPVKGQFQGRHDDVSDASSLLSFAHTTSSLLQDSFEKQDAREPAKTRENKAASVREDSTASVTGKDSTLRNKDSCRQVKRTIDDLRKYLHDEKRKVKLTVACSEFDHWDEAKHNEELRFGGADVLCLIVVMSHDEDDIRMTCAALEMIFRGSASYIHSAFDKVAASLIPRLLQILIMCEKKMLKFPDKNILNITKTLTYFSRIPELRSSLGDFAGMMEALARVSTVQLTPHSRTCRMRLTANLANCDYNKPHFLEVPGLIEAILRIAALDSTDAAREYASNTLMDLAECRENQIPMCNNNKLLGTLVKLVVTESTPETREAAITAIQNLAFCQENRMRLVSFSSGIVLEALKKNLSADKNDKARRRAAGALTNLACEQTAEKLGNHRGLLDMLAIISSKDESTEVQSRASMALKKMATNITVKMSCYGVLLDALVMASSSSHSSALSVILRIKARDPENRESMARHPGVLDALARICIAEDLPLNDRDHAMRAIMHLTNDNQNCKIMCQTFILNALVVGASMDVKANEITESAIIALERLATEVSNREIMARHDGLLTAVAKATEREAKPIASGKETSPRERLAKPLLMSLLVAMQ